MNVLDNALSLIPNLIPSQDIRIISDSGSIVNGVMRPNTKEIDLIGHIQPLSEMDLKVIADGVVSSTAYYRVFSIGNNLELARSMLNESREVWVLWNEYKYFVFAKQDWSLNGWIEFNMALIDND